VKLALLLLDKVGSRESAGEVISFDIKSITSGEHLGNAIVHSSLLEVFLLRHLPTLALVSTQNWKNLERSMWIRRLFLQK